MSRAVRRVGVVVASRTLLAAALVFVGCGADRQVPMTSNGGGGAQGDARAGGTGTSGAGGGGAAGAAGGATGGAAGGATGGAAGGAGGAETPLPGGEWASWPMPNPASTGLPNPASYTDDGDGVVRDGVTGLVWQRSPSPGTYSAQDAKQHCLSLGAEWRLPTIIELVSLVDYTRVRPAIDERFGREMMLRIWSASSMASSTSGAWSLYVHEGVTVAETDNTAKLPVRCVRAGLRSTLPHYERVTVASTPAVKDNWTGLIWQQPVMSPAASFADAIRACQALGEAWRLPSMKELQTLVDRGRTNPSIDPTFFPNTPGMRFWTSSPTAGNPSIVWSVDFAVGTASTYAVANTHGVRCVR